MAKPRMPKASKAGKMPGVGKPLMPKPGTTGAAMGKMSKAPASKASVRGGY